MKPVAIVDYLRLATGYLENCGSGTARLDAELLLADVLDLDRMALYVNFDRPLEPAEVATYRDTLRRRCQGTPIAYITGRKEFLTATLTVNSAVLIPRPETELLVEAIVERLGDGEWAKGAPLIADVGTGSGAIAIGLARALPTAELVAVDVSSDALAVARDNAARHDLDDRIQFIAGDLLTPLLVPPRDERYAGQLDVIVSNPPYIPTNELEKLPRDIKQYEPRVALDGGPDGLALYRRLVPAAARGLKSGGLLALEIGSDQGPALRSLLADAGGWERIEVLRDYADLDRIVLAWKGATDANPRPAD